MKTKKLRSFLITCLPRFSVKFNLKRTKQPSLTLKKHLKCQEELTLYLFRFLDFWNILKTRECPLRWMLTLRLRRSISVQPVKTLIRIKTG